MEGTSEAAAVREALNAGRLTVPDPETGFHYVRGEYFFVPSLSGVAFLGELA